MERGRMGLILRLLFTFILRMVATIVEALMQVFIFQSTIVSPIMQRIERRKLPTKALQVVYLLCILSLCSLDIHLKQNILQNMSKVSRVISVYSSSTIIFYLLAWGLTIELSSTLASNLGLELLMKLSLSSPWEMVFQYLSTKSVDSIRCEKLSVNLSTMLIRFPIMNSTFLGKRICSQYVRGSFSSFQLLLSSQLIRNWKCTLTFLTSAASLRQLERLALQTSYMMFILSSIICHILLQSVLNLVTTPL